MNNERIHFGYIVSFLILTIIALITIKWGAIEELTDYITFALTITSLVLALLAIVYSFFSNSAMTKNISNLEEASKNISSNSDILNDAANRLESSLTDIPGTLKNIESKADHTLKAFEKFSQKEINITRKDDAKERDKTEPLGKKVCYNGSISSRGALLALKLAFESKKLLDIEGFTAEVDLSDKDYILGFFIALSSINLFEYESIEMPDGKWHWSITQVDKDILSNIDSAIQEIENEYKDDDHMSFISEGYKRVRAYFK